MKNAVVRVATALILLVSCAFPQQPRTAFNGTWKLAPQLSKFGPYSNQAVDVYTLNLSEPKLEIVHLFNGERQWLEVVLDGKERNVIEAISGATSAKGYWDADTIVVEKRQAIGGGSSTWTMRYSLSADGKVLTIQHHVLKSPVAPAFDEERVYLRQ